MMLCAERGLVQTRSFNLRRGRDAPKSSKSRRRSISPLGPARATRSAEQCPALAFESLPLSRDDNSRRRHAAALANHCGEGGIRTLDAFSHMLVFETSAFDHSATSPSGARESAPYVCGPLCGPLSCFSSSRGGSAFGRQIRKAQRTDRMYDSIFLPRSQKNRTIKPFAEGPIV